ncbi:MAG: thermonuclease family protein [Acidiferrobacterales bacterium]|nr:thermonuclease family protein [Acidiferrobacterales bacterium]
MSPAGTAQKASPCGAFFIALRLAVLTCVVLSVSACATDSDTVVVDSVIDGDTVRLRGGETVRLLGINAPEKDRKDRPAQPLSLEATLLLKELISGRSVRLTRGKEEKDQYNRTLGYLDLLDGTDVQRVLVERGYAFAIAFPPNIERLDVYLEAEHQARKNKVGVWSLDDYEPVLVPGKRVIDTGFGLITGKITKIGSSKKNVRLHLGKHLVIGVRHEAWDQFWQLDPKDLVGKTVEARGWIQGSRNKKTPYLRVRHPAMMEIK